MSKPTKPHDVRAVANRILRIAWSKQRKITNLQLNKITYFAYVEYMRSFSTELTGAKIEAWKYGPVFRELYSQFKGQKDQPIEQLAQKVDFGSGQYVAVEDSFDSETAQFLDTVAEYYIDVPAGVLVDLSHARGGAWDMVWNHEEDLNVGMEITAEHVRRFEVQTGKRIRTLQ